MKTPRTFLVVLGVVALSWSPARLSASEKLPAPTPATAPAPGKPADPVERQFEDSTGEAATTRRVRCDRALTFTAAPTMQATFDLEPSAWTDADRKNARVWIAVSAADELSKLGPIEVTFAQNGVATTTSLHHGYAVDGTMVLGCDYVVADGPVTVTVARQGHPAGTAFGLHAIAYAATMPRR